MKRVVLKQTSNPNFQHLVGQEGYLSEAYDRFMFDYFGQNREIKSITSSKITSVFSYRIKEEKRNEEIFSSQIETVMGGLKKLCNGIISYKTRNSSYEFEVLNR